MVEEAVYHQMMIFYLKTAEYLATQQCSPSSAETDVVSSTTLTSSLHFSNLHVTFSVFSLCPSILSLIVL
jgi:hypothetical protein